MPKVLVTGLGAITPVGNSIEENRLSFVNGKSGISHMDMVSSRYSKLLPFGEIKQSNEEFKSVLKIKDQAVSRNSLLALHALKEALEMSGLGPDSISAPNTALISANTTGGICATDEMHHDLNSFSNPSGYINDYDCGSVSIFLQKQFNIKGIVNTINTACSSSANAIGFGFRLIKNGLADRALVGGVDSLCKFTINGFNALGILSPDKCRPFDKNRSGLNLGEGAAFLVLEREELVGNKTTYGEVSGYANNNDAYHPSALSPDGKGPYLAMQNAMASANLTAVDIDFVNAHGTATENNDRAEAVAMERFFGVIPKFISSKSNIGHTLGAAGAIEGVISILNLFHQDIYPSLNFSEPMNDTDIRPNLSYAKHSLNHAMSNSFGFGGNCSSIIFSKV